VVLSSIAFWLLLSRWSNAPTLHPLSVDFPTKAGEYSYPFRITSADRYFISISCKPEGPLQGKTIAMGRETEAAEIPCNLWIGLSTKGRVVHQQLVGTMETTYFTISDGRLGFSLLYVDLEELGGYQLAIDNRQDISYLDSTDPILNITISDATIESRIVIAGIMSWGCIAMGIVGAIFAMMGFIARN
jgi:hypothetical protein